MLCNSKPLLKSAIFVSDIYDKEVDNIIHQMVYGCDLPESSRCEDNEVLNPKSNNNKRDPKLAAKIAARDKKAKNKCKFSIYKSVKIQGLYHKDSQHSFLKGRRID